MKNKTQIIKRNFYAYKSLKKYGEYFLDENSQIRIDAICITSKKMQKRIFEKDIDIPNGIKVRYRIIDDKIIDELSPNNIDSNLFWKEAVQVAPFASTSFSPEAKNISELNEMSLQNNHIRFGAISKLSEIFDKKNDAKILEIGPGYGCVLSYIIENYKIDNYYAIDVNPLLKFKRLYKTDGKNIPWQIPYELDVVYSVNVFQHLTPEQRMSYYRQIKESLRVGGKFIFSMFVLDYQNASTYIPIDESKGCLLFGCIDKNGNRYTQFFNQFTRCSTIEELVAIFKELDMDFEIINRIENSYYMVVTKR
jgi:SAM-dependent methyltransferase